MNSFKNYWLSIPVPKRSDFAVRCGTTANYLNMVAHGQKSANESLAVDIERESGGVVALKELRPAFAEKLQRAGYKKRTRKAVPELTEKAA